MNWLDSTGKPLIRRISSSREARLRQIPRIQVASLTNGLSGPAVYYLCPDSDVPTGGIRTIYRHVDALNSIGIPSAVIHKRAGFACTWFRHQTPTVGAGTVALSPRDVLVIPEFYWSTLSTIPVGPHVVVFNQNTYRTFVRPRPSSPKRPYSDVHRLEAMVVVSADNAEYVRYTYPELRVDCIRNAVDRQIFYPAQTSPGKRIAVMPRRRNADCRQVLDLLTVRGCTEEWEIVSIYGRSEQETAEALRSCAIFLCFSELEGFGMPPAEAMACGCYVVGFTGFGGREFFDPDICSPVEEGNILAFAKAAEQAILNFTTDWSAMRQRGLAASARVTNTYSPEAQLADLQRFFKSILKVLYRVT